MITETQTKDRLDEDFLVLTIELDSDGTMSAANAEALRARLSGLKLKRGLRGLILVPNRKEGFLGSELCGAAHDSLAAAAEALAALDVPSVFVLGEETLGSAFEFALAARFRVAAPNARVGLPQVRLGVTPAAGGLRRLVLRAGALTAQRLAGAGESLSAIEARDLGLLDGVDVNPDAAARHCLTRGPAERPMNGVESDVQNLANRQQRKLKSGVPLAIRDALCAMDAGAADADRILQNAGLPAPDVAALRHLWRAERAAAAIPAEAARAASRQVRKVGIVGAGTMGGGIAMTFAKAGFDVILSDRSDEAVTAGIERIASNLDRSVKRGSIEQTDAETQRRHIQPATGLAPLTDCDLIIEAAFEDIEVKRQIFTDLDRIARDGAILATNTSYLDVNDIAAVTTRPEDILGLHFFSPANVMSLLEIVRGEGTAPDVLRTAVEVARRIGKQPVTVGVCYGFVGNRMLSARNAQVSALLLEGASPVEVDTAFRGLGWPMGPCEMGDLVGLDVSWRIRQGRGSKDPLADRLYDQGRYGQKTGRGWYSYSDGRTPIPDPEVDELIECVAAELGVARRNVPAEEIIARTHDPMIAEARQILDEGIVARASDIDVIYAHGYGFPRRLGGPMYWNQTLRDGDRTSR